MNDAASDATAFGRSGYRALRGLLAGAELAAVDSWARSMEVASGTGRADDQVAGAPAFYAPAVTEFLLGKFAPAVEQAIGCRVFPTYSYLRIYKAGSRLARHTDRAACEFTLSLALGCDSPRPWPIGLETAEGARSFTLAPGDALLFRGCELSHWRDPFEGS
ncbi:MAG TPA: hypothetical protein VLA52_12535, partial [Thermohalobaculum sp.]|nr:hypothetical protein [Thermohalobaculum sp.]